MADKFDKGQRTEGFNFHGKPVDPNDKSGNQKTPENLQRLVDALETDTPVNLGNPIKEAPSKPFTFKPKN